TFAVERAVGADGFQVVRLLGVGGGDDVAVLVLGDREQPVHLLHRLPAHANRVGDAFLRVVAEVDVAHVGAHRREPVQHPLHGGNVPGGEQVREILHGDPQRVDRGEEVV